jgi:hypothetical protein
MRNTALLGSVILVVCSFSPAALRIGRPPLVFQTLTDQVDRLGEDTSPEEVEALLPESPALPRGQEAYDAYSLSRRLYTRALVAAAKGKPCEALRWKALASKLLAWVPECNRHHFGCP